MCLFVATLSLTGCGASVTGGIVYSKQYTPHKEWDTMGGYEYTCLPGLDGKMDCKYKYSPFVTEHHVQNECYELRFRNAERKEGSACVTETDYNNTAIGDHWGVE